MKHTRSIYFKYVLLLYLAQKSSYLLAQKKKVTQLNEEVSKLPLNIDVKVNKKKSINNNKNQIYLKNYINETSRTLGEVLAREDGVSLQKLGAIGSYSSLSIRALNPNQTNISIDGVQLADPLGQSINLENLPIRGIFESVEIYKSNYPIEINGSSLGGVINLVPKFLDKNTKNIFIDTYYTSLNGGGVGVGFNLPFTSQFINYETALNNYRFINNNNTPYNKQDDKFDIRQNEDFKNLNYSSYYKFNINKNTIKILLNVFNKERGIAGSISTPYYHLRLKEENTILKASHQYIIYNNIIWENSIAYFNNSSRTKDPNKELYFNLVEGKRLSNTFEISSKPSLYILDERLKISLNLFATQTNLFQNEINFALRNSNSFALGLQYREVKWGEIILNGKIISVKDNIIKDFSNSNNNYTNFYQNTLNNYQIRYNFFPFDFLNVYSGTSGKKIGDSGDNGEIGGRNSGSGVASDDNGEIGGRNGNSGMKSGDSGNNGGKSGDSGSNGGKNNGSGGKSGDSGVASGDSGINGGKSGDSGSNELVLYVDYFKSNRFPSIIERFGDSFFTIPNINLKTERGDTISSGVLIKNKNNKNFSLFNLSYFNTIANDLILFYQISQRVLRAENIGKAQINGIEAKIKYEYDIFFISQLTFTYLQALDKGDLPFYYEKNLPFQPRFNTNLYLESGNKTLRSFINFNYISEVYKDRLNTKENYEENKLRADIGIKYYINYNKSSRLSFIIKNLLDSYQSDIVGYPLPNRTYEIQYYQEFDFNK